MVYAQPDPVLYDHLGDVYFSMDNTTEARKAWKTSLALTLKRLEDPSGEIPDPKTLREKIRKAEYSAPAPSDSAPYRDLLPSSRKYTR